MKNLFSGLIQVTERKKKSPSKFNLKRLVIFIVLFIAILSGLLLHLREVEWQKRRPAEAVCITHGLNRTSWELDNCVEGSLMLSALLEAGMPLKDTVFALLEAGLSPEETVVALFVTTGLSAAEIGKIVTAAVSDPPAAEASRG